MEANNVLDVKRTDIIEAAKALLLLKYGESYHTEEDSIEEDAFRYLKKYPLKSTETFSRDSMIAIQQHFETNSCNNSAVKCIAVTDSNSSSNAVRPTVIHVNRNSATNQKPRRVLTAKRRSLNARKLRFSVESVSDETDDQHMVEEETDFMTLGPNGSQISTNAYNAIDWSHYSKATRGLLRYFFPREILATHTLSGRPCPAQLHKNLPWKGKLDPKIVGDIIHAVITNCPGKVLLCDARHAITIACADEGKLLKNRRRNEMPRVKERIQE